MKIRRYSQLPGSPISITWLLGQTIPKPELNRWKLDTVMRLAREYPGETLSAERLLGQYGPRCDVRGTEVHRAIAATLTGRPLPVLSAEAAPYYAAWATWDETARAEATMEAVEMTVQHDILPLAGTLDLLDAWEGDRLVVDWKTASNLPDAPWIDHVAQVAFYADCADVAAGCVVYISSAGVRPHYLDEEAIDRGRHAYEAAVGMFEAVYPGVLWGEDDDADV